MARRNWISSLILLMISLAACSASPTAAPTLPTIPTVYVSPFGLPLARSLSEPYIDQFGALPFDLVPTGSQDAYEAISREEAELLIDYPPIADGWFATPLGWEGIAIIVHPDVPVRSLTLSDLADIYSGRQDNWQVFGLGQGTIQPVIPPNGDTMRSVFTRLVLPRGRVTTLARLSPTPAEAVRIVAETEGAIGLLPEHYVIDEGDVSFLRIEGYLPVAEDIRSGNYPLRSQIVAAAPTEPTGEIRAWLAWVQGHGGGEP